MICFALYMAYLWPTQEDKKLLIGLFSVQWILNVAWNPAFFYLHKMGLALIIISALTVVVGYFLINYKSNLQLKSLLIVPYALWLVIATSLNAYAYFQN